MKDEQTIEYFVTVTVIEKHIIATTETDPQRVAEMVNDGEIETSSRTMVGIMGHQVQKVVPVKR